MEGLRMDPLCRHPSPPRLSPGEQQDARTMLGPCMSIIEYVRKLVCLSLFTGVGYLCIQVQHIKIIQCTWATMRKSKDPACENDLKILKSNHLKVIYLKLRLERNKPSSNLQKDPGHPGSHESPNMSKCQNKRQDTDATSGTKCCKVFKMLSCSVTALCGHPRHAPCKRKTTSPVALSQDFSWTSPPSSWTEGRMRCSNTSKISVASVASKGSEEFSTSWSTLSGRFCKTSWSCGAKACHCVPGCLVIASQVPEEPSCTKTSWTPGISSNWVRVLLGTLVTPLWNFQTFGLGVSWNAHALALRYPVHGNRLTSLCRKNGGWARAKFKNLSMSDAWHEGYDVCFSCSLRAQDDPCAAQFLLGLDKCQRDWLGPKLTKLTKYKCSLPAPGMLIRSHQCERQPWYKSEPMAFGSGLTGGVPWKPYLWRPGDLCTGAWWSSTWLESIDVKEQQ